MAQATGEACPTTRNTAGTMIKGMRYRLAPGSAGGAPYDLVLFNDEGVERVFMLNSPNVTKIDVKRRGKVRRAKLYYLRDRVGKATKVKELRVTRARKKKASSSPKQDDAGENTQNPEK